jgi:hypothetical protein
MKYYSYPFALGIIPHKLMPFYSISEAYEYRVVVHPEN